MRRSLAVIAAAFLITLFGIWWPELRHYHVSTPEISDEAIQELRTVPADEVFARLNDLQFDPPRDLVPGRGSVAAADNIIRGTWDEPAFGLRRVHFPFDQRDLSVGWPTQQLSLASLGHVGVLLAASRSSGDERYLAAASDVIDAWSRFERAQVLPKGFLWNDHAIAQRILVLSDFWAQYRNSKIFEPERARGLLQFVARSGRMLEKPDHVTARTNHGVMQSLALLHISVAFPELSDSDRFREVAIRRLGMQLEYYISEEGVVLEHSPSYHVLGAQLLAALKTYQELIGRDLGLRVNERFAEACAFLQTIVRPDGTLPLIGNTGAMAVKLPCAIPDGHPQRGLSTYPVSGYAVRWSLPEANDGAVSQTVVGWGNFLTRAHKHDDELAVTTWIAGRPMLTGAGYFPYGHELQKAANGWRGANGPHLRAEAPKHERYSALLASGSTHRLAFLDLERRRLGDDVRIRRQVLMLDGDTWIVLDSSNTKAAGEWQTVWTLFPGWSLEAVDHPGDYLLRDGKSGAVGSVSVRSPAGVKTRLLRGSNEPFGGWVALDMTPTAVMPALSLEVIAEAGATAVTVWRVGAVNAVDPLIREWDGQANWTICLDGDVCRNGVRRADQLLTAFGKGLDSSLRIQPQDDVRHTVNGINESFQRAIDAYPPWQDFLKWKKQASGFLLLAFVAQVLILAGLKLLARRHGNGAVSRRLVIISGASAAVWVLGGVWLVFVYFGTA